MSKSSASSSCMDSAILESSENERASLGEGDRRRNPGDLGLGEGVLRITGGLWGGDIDRFLPFWVAAFF